MPRKHWPVQQYRFIWRRPGTNRWYEKFIKSDGPANAVRLLTRHLARVSNPEAGFEVDHLFLYKESEADNYRMYSMLTAQRIAQAGYSYIPVGDEFATEVLGFHLVTGG